MAELERLEHPWVQEYFNGPRGRAAQASKKRAETMDNASQGEA